MYTLMILATFDHRVVHICLHKNAVLFLANKGKSEISEVGNRNITSFKRQFSIIYLRTMHCEWVVVILKQHANVSR